MLHHCSLSLYPVYSDLRLSYGVTFTSYKHFCGYNYPVPDTSGHGVLFSVDFFLSLLARLWENGWTNLHEIFKEGVEWSWDNLIQFWVNSEKLRDAVTLISFLSFVNITSKQLDRFAWNFHGRCGVWPCDGPIPYQPQTICLQIVLCQFLARDSMLSALYAIANPSVHLSVRLSVHLSVCLSHGWISRKRLKLGSCNFHRTVAPSL